MLNFNNNDKQNWFFGKTLGFSLIELLVVISIIGILTAVLLTNFVGARERAADVKRKNDLVQLKKALRLYYNDNQNYPAVIDLPPVSASFTDGSGTVYMKEVPEYSQYRVSSDGEQFVLVVALDNISDQQISESQSKCANSLNASGISGITLNLATDYVVCED